MAEAKEIILSGSGGQGLITAGIILAEAAVLDGKNTVQSQSYGPEARGGKSRAEVIISSDEIDYPKVTRPDAVLAMTGEACSAYAPKLSQTGLLLVDSTCVKEPPVTKARVVSCPFSRIAREELGKEVVANVVALGALAAATGVVSRESLLAALLKRVPPGTGELNRRALELGWQTVRRAAA
ncbi:MAG: 2-oxoacid:acceptor oxidoreductase family protein [Peptococcaceae bacterium]|nr:2-oxoacid:acceptor oxidoreductase family protein [Peptococcaceae bacterium]